MAFIFKRDNTGGWDTNGQQINGDVNRDNRFGCSVAISSEFAIVGAGEESSAKKAFIFKNTGGIWSLDVEIDQYTSFNGFGASVGISGEFAIVGAAVSSGTPANKAFIFKNTGGTWGTTTPVTLDGTGHDGFGAGVAISGEFAFVGADVAKKVARFT